MLITATVEDPAAWEASFRTHGDLFHSQGANSPILLGIAEGNVVAVLEQIADLPKLLANLESTGTQEAMQADGVRTETVRIVVLDKEFSFWKEFRPAGAVHPRSAAPAYRGIVSAVPITEPAQVPRAEQRPADPLPGDSFPECDPVCLVAAQRGDRNAFAQLVRTYQARILGVAWRMTADRSDAEELAQDTFVQLHRHLAQLDDVAHLRHWLLRTVTHRCIDRLRQRRRRPRVVALLPEMPAAVEEAPGDPLALRRLRTLLLQLAPDARAVMLLRYQEDLDPLDIATVLAMPVNTVKSHLKRSLDWLRAQAGDVHG